MNLTLPTPLPTPPNSTKTKVEHNFDDHAHDHHNSADAPLFAPEQPRSERGTSPTDAVLFSQRDARFATASPSTTFRDVSPKRPRLDNDSTPEDSPRKAMRISRSPTPERSFTREISRENLLESSTKPETPQPLTQLPPFREAFQQAEQQPDLHRRYHRLSNSERELVTSFRKSFSAKVVDYGTEKWFHVKHDPATHTWLQPSFDLVTPSPVRKFAPINGHASLKPKSANSIVTSVEVPHRQARPSAKKQQQQKQLKAQRAPRKRSSATPTHNNHLPNGKSETRSTRNPANKPLSSKDYRDYPDYAPRTPNNGADAMKLARNIPQMSGSKDLSADPLRSELTDAELVAAEKAGMDCARYLCTKRAVFVGFIKHLRYLSGKYELTPEDVKKGLKSWNKTAAQGCSGIDVNKTSALWAGFWQPMGWFDKDAYKSLAYADEIYFPKFDKEGNVVPQYNRAGNLMH